MTTSPPSTAGLSRRALLGRAGAFAALVGAGVVVTGGRGGAAAVLRPPGAALDFDDKCIRCFRCAQVCPVDCIVFPSVLDPATPPRLADTPIVVAHDRGCILCMRCTQVCPTDALLPLTQSATGTVDLVLLAAQGAHAMGTAVLERAECLAWSGRGECRLCHDVCPVKGSVTLNERLLPVVHDDVCVGCGLCEAACPVDTADTEGKRRKAIRVRPWRTT